MKGTDRFKEAIKLHLDQLASEDSLFRAKYEVTTRTLDDIVAYIICEVQKSGSFGFTDDEVYSLAVHVIDEPDIEIPKNLPSGQVIINHQVELTEEEKAEIKAQAMKKFQQQEMTRLQAENYRPKVKKPLIDETPSLFDF